MFSEDFLHFIHKLKNAETTPEVSQCWSTISRQYPDTEIVVGVKDRTYLSRPYCLKTTSFDEKAYFRSYYSTDSLFLLNSKVAKKINIKHSVFLDTNLTIYIKNFVSKKDLVRDYNKDLNWRTIVNVIEHILYYGLDCNHYCYIL